MTVKEFEQKRRDVERVRTDLKDGADYLVKLFGILQEAKVPDDVIEKIRLDLNQAIMAGNAAAKELLSYGLLLDDIARRTKLDWPPACGIEGMK